MTAPAGTACGLFACDGRVTTCPTQCTATSGCAAGAGCSSSGQCQRCWSAFTDDFSTGANQWTLTGANISGVLRLEVQARPNRTELATAQVIAPSQLRGCGVTVELTAQPDVTTGFLGKVGLFPSAGTTPSFRWDLDARGLVAAWSLGDGGTGAMVVAGPSATWPRWLRIEEGTGQVRFRTSTGGAFSTVQTVTHGELLEATVFRVEAGFPQQPGNDRTTLALDNVNLGP